MNKMPKSCSLVYLRYCDTIMCIFLRQDAGSSICTVRSAEYMSCLMPTKMFNNANKLCLDELCRASSFSGGFLGNKGSSSKHIHHIIRVSSFSARRRRESCLRAAVCAAYSDNGWHLEVRPITIPQATAAQLDREF